MLANLAIIPVLLIVATSLGLLLGRTWRAVVLALAIQYLAVFWLVGIEWPFGLAAVKLVVGWMAAALLSASQPEESQHAEDAAVSGLAFRGLAAGLVAALVFSVSPSLLGRFPAGLPVLQGGLLLVGGGLLQLGMTTRPMRVVIGLLSMLSGFELLYAAVETSVLVAGLQAVITLGLALVGVYLISLPVEGGQP